MAHLVLCLVYFSFGLFLYTYKYAIFFSTLHVFVVAVLCVCFCYFFFFLFTFFFSSVSAIWCCFMLNNVRICIIWYSKHVVHTKAKILGKKNLPLTTCIYLSQIRCVSFIVYHTHIWSFHSILLSFACSLSLFISPSLSLFQSIFFWFFLIFFFWLSALIVLRATSFALIPYCNPRVATVIFLCIQRSYTLTRTLMQQIEMNYLKWNFLPFEECFSSENAECITRFYDIWSIQNMYHPVRLSVQIFLSTIYLSHRHFVSFFFSFFQWN